MISEYATRELRMKQSVQQNSNMWDNGFKRLYIFVKFQKKIKFGTANTAKLVK